MEIVPGAGWENVLEELLKEGGRAVIVGAADSGKSSIARYFVERFLAVRRRVCLVDADVGQSALGLPGTISAKRFRRKKDLKDYRYERMFFVGDVNPARRIPLMIEGTRNMVKSCGEAWDVTLLDTTGLISGRAAEVLKTGKIRAINPEHIIALQREDELEPLLSHITDVRVHRPGVSAMARTRSAAERALYRMKKLADYFDSPGSDGLSLSEKEAIFLHRGIICEPNRDLFPENTVIGLNHGCETIGLGLIIEVRDHEVIFRSPVSSLRRVSVVEFGDIRLRDMGSLPAGKRP